MKDSGIEWIGEIPEDWDIGRIGELYTERKTKVSDLDFQPLSVTMKGIVPQLANAAKSDAHDDRKLVRKGDFAINSRSDRRGSCGISDYDGSVSLINTILTPRNNMNPNYYNWLFHTTLFADEFYKWGHGIVDDLWTTNWSDMKNITIPVPLVTAQQQIADFLDDKVVQIDSVISKTRETIEEYKKLKQSIITEVVTGKVKIENGKVCGTYDTYKDSGIEWIGEIPEEWKKIKFKYLHCGMNTGEAIDKEYWSSNEYDRVFYTAGLLPIRTTYLEFPEWKLTRDNDLLLSRNGTPYVYLPSEYACYTDHIIRAKIKKDVCKKFLQYVLQRSISTIVVNQVSIATWSASLWNEQILPFPPLSEQQQIADYLDKKCSEIDNLISKKEQLVVELESYKKSLIYEVVTGKRSVI